MVLLAELSMIQCYMSNGELVLQCTGSSGFASLSMKIPT